MATPEVIAEQQALVGINADYKEKFGFHDPETGYAFKAPKGLTRELVEQISEFKNEPQWMREFRLKALEHFLSRPQPTWGSPMLAEVDYDNIHYFVRASEKSSKTWDDVPDDIKKHVRPAGHPRGRAQVPLRRRRPVRVRGRLPPGPRGPREAGHHVHGHGLGPARARGPRPRVLRDDHPANDNKLAALNSAVWSGGSFVYVPPGVHVEMPLQAYFRINTENMGQFERTLIIADEGSYVHYVEGCTAPVWSTDSLHSAVVELIAKPGARIRYTTVQNWSQNVYNLVTKRAIAETDATVEWVDCNLGSKLTMKYPSGLPDGRARARRGAVDRLRRQGPAPGRGRQDRPRGAEHDVEHLRQVDLQGRRALARTAACSRSPRARTARSRRWSATRCCSTSTRARTPTRRSASARTTWTSATRRPSPRSARSSSST